jgi:hypothetical protein
MEVLNPITRSSKEKKNKYIHEKKASKKNS